VGTNVKIQNLWQQWRSWGKGASGAAAPGGTVQEAAEWRIFQIKFLDAFSIKIAKKHQFVSSNLSLCLYAWNNQRTTEPIFMKFRIWDIYEKLSNNSKFHDDR
jgi:hypothetical protein